MSKSSKEFKKYSIQLMHQIYAEGICGWPGMELDQDDKSKLEKAAHKLCRFLKDHPQYDPEERTSEENLNRLAGKFYKYLMGKQLKSIFPGYMCHYKTWAGFCIHLMPLIEPRIAV